MSSRRTRSSGRRSQYDRALSPVPPLIRQLSLQRGNSGISDYVRIETRPFVDLYPKVQLIGKGAFGKVFKAQRKTEDGTIQEVAVKELDFNIENEFGPKDVKAASKEIEIQRKIQCSPYSSTVNCAIVPIYDAFYNPLERKLYIEMQYIEGKSLETLIQGIPPYDFRFDAGVLYPNFLRLIHTLVQMHHAGILHRDIKLSNILYETGTGLMYLVDFGLSCEKPLCYDTLGDRYYRDPRMLKDEITTPDELSDIFALGITFLQSLTRKSIEQLAGVQTSKQFQDIRIVRRALANGLREMLSKIQYYQQLPDQDLIQVDLHHVILLADVIAHMIAEDDAKRITLQAILNLLNT
jgi:serine/threonine protein kinase